MRIYEKIWRLIGVMVGLCFVAYSALWVVEKWRAQGLWTADPIVTYSTDVSRICLKQCVGKRWVDTWMDPGEGLKCGCKNLKKK